MAIFSNIGDGALSFSGVLLRIARIRDEQYDCVGDPERIIGALPTHRPSVDVFSFIQEFTDKTPHFSYMAEAESLAVLPVAA